MNRRDLLKGCGVAVLGGVAAKLGIEARVPYLDATTVPSARVMTFGVFESEMHDFESQHFFNGGGTHRVALIDNTEGGRG